MYNGAVQTIAQMFQENSTDDDGPRHLELGNLFCEGNDCPYETGNLASAIQLCPFIVQVDISKVSAITDGDLQALLTLESLRNLSLDDVGVSFDGGISPILHHFGRGLLERLELRRLRDVNVSVIVETCSNLRALSLEDIRQYIPWGETRRSYNFHHRELQLRYLCVRRVQSLQVPPAADISLLLQSCPELVELRLDGMITLEDSVLLDATESNRFAKLELLGLWRCGSLSKQLIDHLLTLDSPLKKIELEQCWKLRKEHVEAWEKEAETNNWDLSIAYNQH